MESKNRHRDMLCTGLHEKLTAGKYTDFTLTCLDEKEFKCHRVILAAVSPFFDTMFESGMREAELGRAELPFEGETIDLILKYIYAGNDVITGQDIGAIPALYYAANYLQIASLVEDCEDFLSKGMNPHISLKIWQISKKFNNHQVIEVAKSILLQNFGSFCKVDSIGEIGLEDLKSLLQDKFINCSGSIKCKAAWVWLVAKETIELDVAKALITSLVTSENVDSEDILTTRQSYWDELLDDGIECDHLTKGKEVWETACRELWIQPESTANASTISLKECFIVLGGTPLDASRLTVLNFKNKLWYKVKAEKRDLGHRYAVCSLGSLLYLSGGTMNQKGFLCFNPDTKRWSAETNLPIGREQHVMCTVPENTIRSERRTVEKKIYLLGGTSNEEPKLKDIHVYDIRTMRWTKFGEIAYAVAATSSTVVDKRIYLLGGAAVEDGRSRSPIDLIQCFDTARGYSWKVDLKLPFKAKSQKMEVVCFESDQMSHEEYVVHDKKVYKLKLDQRNCSIEEVGHIPNAPTKGFATANFGDKIFIFGGEDDSFRCSRDVLQFDITTRQTVILPNKTPFEMSDFAHTNIPIPDSWDIRELAEN